MGQLLVNTLIAGSLAALIASGLGIVYGLLRVFNLALGQTVLIGGYLVWWLHQNLGWPLLPSMFGGVAIGAVLSWLTFDFFMAPFVRYHQWLPLVTTIALSMILDGIILLAFGEAPHAISPNLQQMLTLGSVRISIAQITLVLGTLLILGLWAYIFTTTPFGRKLRATAQSQHVAMSLGIPSHKLQRVLVIMSGILACLGGVFIGIDQNLTPTLGFHLTIKAYAAVIAGGMGNVWGTVACAFGIALIEQLAVGTPWWFGTYISASYQSVVALLVIIALLLWKPQGLFASHSRTA
jgi:branched-chain amino acid transport system permease protein